MNNTKLLQIHDKANERNTMNKILKDDKIIIWKSDDNKVLNIHFQGFFTSSFIKFQLFYNLPYTLVMAKIANIL